MPKRSLPAPTFAPRTPLRQFLEAADLPAVVPQLHPRTLHRLVGALGLEDAGEVLSLATPEQLVRVLDMDVWQRSSRSPSDAFDPGRFGTWLRVMVEEGVEVAAAKLMGFDRAFVVTTLAQHVAVCSRKTAEMRRLSDEAATCELGGMVVVARRDDAWDAIVPLLVHLHAEQSAFFGELMAGCRDLSYEYLEEASGFDNLVGRREQALGDLSMAREERLEQQGYVTRPRARAFLDGARHVALTDAAPPPEWEARSYFSAVVHEERPAHVQEGEPEAANSQRLPLATAQASADAATLSALLGEGDTPGTVRGLLGGGSATPDALVSRVAARLSLLAETTPEAHQQCVSELGYLSNVLLESGVLPQARSLETDAVAAAVATCDLGLQRWPAQWSIPASSASLVDAFKVGWTVLHSDVCLRAAKQLAGTLRHLRVAVSETHQDILVLRRTLERSIQAGRPWEARSRLDVIAILDTPAWATLLLLISEFPAVPRGCLHPAQHARRHTTEVEFIDSEAHLAWTGEFLDRLLETLSA